MTDRIGDRFAWAAETLDVAPSERLLEIGCGQGVAVSLVCGSLSDGSITAIDRSKSMIDQAARRNREHIDSGKAVFFAVALGDAAFIADRFDKVFAINVRLFGRDASREANVLKSLLKPRGALYFFQQHPSAERTRAVTADLKTALEGNGFTVGDVKTRGTGSSLMTCIVAKQDPRP